MNSARLHLSALALLLVFCCLVAPLPADAAPGEDFSQGWTAFHNLLKTPSKAKYRSYWMQSRDHFLRAFKASPTGPYAPKSLYYLGRVYQELGKRSYLKKDFLQAVDYFERMVSRFPDHSWADDAQLYKAMIHLENLDDPSQAYIDLLFIEHNYPKGDMLDKAAALLRRMDRQNMDAPPAPVKEVTEESPAPQPARSAPAPAGTCQAELMDIRHWSSDEYTRVVLDLSESVAYEHRLLNPDPGLGTPHRLFIDLESTRLTAATSAEHPVADGILTQVRTGQFSRSQSRVVLDIQDLDNFRVFSLENPFRIVVDVYAPKDATLTAQARARAVSDPYVLDKGSKDLAGSLVEQLGLTIKTVMIDPGHGGKDPGAVFGSLYEKTINLRMAKILGKMLSDKGFHVLYTRTTDTFIPLEERTAIANAKKADLFVSIHVNAHKNAKVNGFELYYLNLARSKDAVRVAARENAVSEKKISDLQVILTDLMLNSKIKESRDLANNVSSSTISHSKRYYADLRDHGVREAPFYVLMGAKMPAILVELGYLTNSRERERLKTDSYLTRMAQGLTNGILAYKKQLESYASLDLPGQ